MASWHCIFTSDFHLVLRFSRMFHKSFPYLLVFSCYILLICYTPYVSNDVPHISPYNICLEFFQLLMYFRTFSQFSDVFPMVLPYFPIFPIYFPYILHIFPMFFTTRFPRVVLAPVTARPLSRRGILRQRRQSFLALRGAHRWRRRPKAEWM